jgi:hypothetical protein
VTAQSKEDDTNVPATNEAATLLETGGDGYRLVSDGVHWMGSFAKLLTLFVQDLLDDGDPILLAFDAYLDSVGDDPCRIAGVVTAITEAEIRFEDGYVLSRKDHEVVAVRVP